MLPWLNANPIIGPQELGPSKYLFIEPYQTAAPHCARTLLFTIDSFATLLPHSHPQSWQRDAYVWPTLV